MILLSAISAVRDGHGLVALWRIVRLFTLSDLFSSSVSLLAVFGMRRPLCQLAGCGSKLRESCCLLCIVNAEPRSAAAGPFTILMLSSLLT